MPANGRWCSAAGKVTVSLSESNGSLSPGLWLRSPAGWLPRTGISSVTHARFEYGNIYQSFDTFDFVAKMSNQLATRSGSAEPSLNHYQSTKAFNASKPPRGISAAYAQSALQARACWPTEVTWVELQQGSRPPDDTIQTSMLSRHTLALTLDMILGRRRVLEHKKARTRIMARKARLILLLWQISVLPRIRNLDCAIMNAWRCFFSVMVKMPVLLRCYWSSVYPAVTQFCLMPQ